MYLSFYDYTKLGGVLEETAFNSLERQARYLVNSQANGRTGTRIAKLTEIPECVKECVFELVSFFSVHNANEKQIASESQSQGGANESLSYVTKTDAEINEKGNEIIYTFLMGGGFGWLLYKGASL